MISCHRTLVQAIVFSNMAKPHYYDDDDDDDEDEDGEDDGDDDEEVEDDIGVEDNDDLDDISPAIKCATKHRQIHPPSPFALFAL